MMDEKQFQECVAIHDCNIGIINASHNELALQNHLQTNYQLAFERVAQFCRSLPSLSSTLGISEKNYSAPQQVPLRFFLLDIVQSVSSKELPTAGLSSSRSNQPNPKVHGDIVLLGITTPPGRASIEKDSITVCCHIHGMIHHFYAVPHLYKPLKNGIMERYRRDLEHFLNRFTFNYYLNHTTTEEARKFYQVNGVSLYRTSVIVTVEDLGTLRKSFERDVFHKCNKNDEWPVFKIETHLPSFVPYAAKGAMDHRIRISGHDSFLNLYGTRIPFSTLFMAEYRIRCNRWMTLSRGTFYLRESNEKETVQDLEVDIFSIPYAINEDMSPTANQLMPPLRLIAFDFETLTRRGKFVVGKCEIIQASIELRRIFNGQSRILCKIIILIGTSHPVPDTLVINVKDKNTPDPVWTSRHPRMIHRESETDLLLWWSFLMRKLDPEGIAGFNSKHFDFLHAQHRIELLTKFNIAPSPIQARFMGKLKGRCFKVSPLVHDLEMRYRYDGKDVLKVEVPGVFLPDLLQLYRKHEILPLPQIMTHKMKEIAKRQCPREGFIELEIKLINRLHAGTPEDRTEIALYCLSDSRLVMVLLLETLPQSIVFSSIMDYYVDIAKEAGIPLRITMDMCQTFCRSMASYVGGYSG